MVRAPEYPVDGQIVARFIERNSAKSAVAIREEQRLHNAVSTTLESS